MTGCRRVLPRSSDHRRRSIKKQAGRLQVAADSPERTSPERQVDRLELGGGITAFGARPGAVQGMNVGASIEQKCDDFGRRCRNRPVQWRPAGTVGAMHQLRLGVQERTNQRCIPGGGRAMDRMVGVSRPGAVASARAYSSNRATASCPRSAPP